MFEPVEVCVDAGPKYDGMRVHVSDTDMSKVDGRCACESDLAAEATDGIAELLYEGLYELRPLGDRNEDRYGRKPRIVTREGESLGDVLVAEGLVD